MKDGHRTITRPPAEAAVTAITKPCPSCGTAGLVPFHAHERAPVLDGRVAASREDALAWPCGSIALAHCPACGFVTDHGFDRESAPFVLEERDAHAVSPTLARFSRHQAGGLVTRWGLQGKTALEIGCGNGAFLSLLCELGMKEGIGFDPAYAPTGDQGKGAKKCRFHAEPYGASHWSTAADLICCRHTLDHIAPVGDFLRMLRENIGDRMDTVVYFETLEAGRVLRDGAFWEIQRGRCSYFTPGSLARLVRAASFEVSELWVDSHGQNLMLTALPADAPTEPAFQMEDDCEATVEASKWFSSVAGAIMDYWDKQVRYYHESGRKVVLWGAGSRGTAFLNALDLGDAIAFAVDIDPARQGRFVPGTGHEIVGPAFLREQPPDIVIAVNAVYEAEIRAELERTGVSADVMTS